MYKTNELKYHLDLKQGHRLIELEILLTKRKVATFINMYTYFTWPDRNFFYWTKIIIIISTFFIVRFLVKSRKKISTEPSEGSTQVVVKRRRFKFAFNSVILNIMFIVLILPLLLSYIIPKNADFNVSDMINTICFTLFYLNFALHFWVHLICNSIFRREFLLLFCIIKNWVFFYSN